MYMQARHLTSYVYKQFGYNISPGSDAQRFVGISVGNDIANALPGDIIGRPSGSSTSTYIGHVVLYIGNGKVIHAASPEKGVIISNAVDPSRPNLDIRRIIY